MNYKRTIKFQYYQIKSQKLNYKRNKVKYKLFDFERWIELMDDNNLVQTEISYNDAKARIEKFDFNDRTNIWGVRLLKLRNTNIPSKAKNNEDARVIELEEGEYLGEDLFLIYDRTNGVALIQQNRLSLGISRLEEFFTETYNRYVGEEDKVSVDIVPILDLNGKNKIKKSRYKNLEISFANISGYVSPDKTTSLGTLLNPLKNMYGVNGSIKISLGRSRMDTLNRKFIQDLVNEINEPSNKRYVRAAKIKIQEEDDCDVEIIDLFNDVFSEYLEFEIDSNVGLNYSNIINVITDKYFERKDELEKVLAKNK